MNKKLFVGLMALVLVTLACSLSNTGSSNVLYKDDFSNSSSGWYTHKTDNSVIAYADGGYRITVMASDIDAFGTVNQTLPADVSIEVDATQTSGPATSSFGIICRYTDNDNFYNLNVGNDGYVAIYRVVSGKSEVISDPNQNWTQSSAVKQGNVLNHLRADCIGSTLTLYVNGTQALSVTDSSLTSGDVGLIGSTWGDGGADTLFDNFVVKKP
jgi:hypothetical protein